MFELIINWGTASEERKKILILQSNITYNIPRDIAIFSTTFPIERIIPFTTPTTSILIATLSRASKNVSTDFCEFIMLRMVSSSVFLLLVS